MRLRDRAAVLIVGLLDFAAVVSLALVIGALAAVVVWELGESLR